MRRKEYYKYNIGFAVCAVLLGSLCGCGYQAKLLEHEKVTPGAGVIVRCNVVKKPIVKVSESGDFIFWWAGGPGPITYSVAQMVNERNNERYRKMLEPALKVNYFCEQFEEIDRVKYAAAGHLVANDELRDFSQSADREGINSRLASPLIRRIGQRF